MVRCLAVAGSQAPAWEPMRTGSWSFRDRVPKLELGDERNERTYQTTQDESSQVIFSGLLRGKPGRGMAFYGTSEVGPLAAGFRPR